MATVNSDSVNSGLNKKRKLEHPGLGAPNPVDDDDADTSSDIKAEDSEPQTVDQEFQYSTSNEIIRTLLATKAEYFLNPDKTVFVCTREDRVVDVWKGMVKHNFQAVPVLQKTQNKYYGFLDLSDIVRHLVAKFGAESTRGDEKFWAQLEEEKAFGETLVDEIMKNPVTRVNPFHPVKKGFSLLFAVELLAREYEMHRVPVVSGPDRQLLNMITQSQVIQFLEQHIDKIGDKRYKPINLCKSFFRLVHQVQLNTIAIDAFELMVEKDITGVAVVDSDGKLVDNLSMRDLKLIGYDVRLFWRFYQSVESFLDKLKAEYQEKNQRPRHVITVAGTETYQSVIHKLASNHIHRIYIVDDHHKPIGIIALQDLLLELLEI